MVRDDENSQIVYKVVVNHEEQYSIWPVELEDALGWTDAGVTGSKSECLAFIKQVWTDMRPLTVRRWMEQQGELEPGSSRQ